MNTHIRKISPPVSRRQIMIGAAGLSFAFASGRGTFATAIATEGGGKSLTPWVSIAEDGTITIMSAATEMGQGSMTAPPLIIAEEFDADWSQVKIVPTPVNDKNLRQSRFWRHDAHAGSNAVRSYYDNLRLFGVQARRVLLDNAARKLGVGVDELTTEPSAVVQGKSGRKLSYGEIAGFAELPAQAPQIKPEDLKKPADFRLITKDVIRAELPHKVNGRAQYSIDVQVPDMLYGAVLRAPVKGAAPDKFDEAKAMAVNGVVKVVTLPYGVGIVANTPLGGVHGASNYRARRRLDSRRQSMELRQRAGTAKLRCQCTRSQRQGDRLVQARRRTRRNREGGLDSRGRIPLRLRLSRTDGAAKHSCRGGRIRRCGRSVVRHAEPDHRARGHGGCP